MARPQTDIDAGRETLLDVVENFVRARGAVDISMTELAGAAGMSPSNLYRYFENKEALLEAVAEKWFAEKVRIMEEVVNLDLPARDKMFAFFARRFAVMVAQYEAEPDLYKSYLEIGNLYFEVVRGYVDLGDHYLSMIVADAMEQGYFPGLTIDEGVSLINQMVQPYCNPEAIIYIGTHRLNEHKLGIIIDTIFAGLGKSLASDGLKKPHIHIVSKGLHSTST
jgi:AcrR family transcriptional regulator